MLVLFFTNSICSCLSGAVMFILLLENRLDALESVRIKEVIALFRMDADDRG